MCIYIPSLLDRLPPLPPPSSFYFRGTVPATVEDEQGARMGTVARRWRRTTTARMVLSHRSLRGPGRGPGLGMKSIPLGFKAQGKLLCREVSARNVCLYVCVCVGGGWQTERGTEDNLPRAAGFKKGRGGNVVSPPPQQGQAPWLSPQSTCCTCTEAALAEEVMGEPLNTQLLGCLSPWRGEKTKLCSLDQR